MAQRTPRLISLDPAETCGSPVAVSLIDEETDSAACITDRFVDDRQSTGSQFVCKKMATFATQLGIRFDGHHIEAFAEIKSRILASVHSDVIDQVLVHGIESIGERRVL
jgi:hypothetical protein